MDAFEHRLAKQRLAPPPPGLREQVLLRASEAARRASNDSQRSSVGVWAVCRAWFYPTPTAWAGLCALWIVILGMNRYAAWIPEQASMELAGPGRWPTLAAWIGERQAGTPGGFDGGPAGRDAVVPPSRPPRRSDAGLPTPDPLPWCLGESNGLLRHLDIFRDQHENQNLA